MNGNFLGKIVDAQFGQYYDRPFLMGLQLEFKFDGNAHITDGGRYLINVSDSCIWDSEDEKNGAYQKILKDLNKILSDAKVHHVSQLIGKPIEVEIENSTFKSFRILTEVI